MVKSSGGEPMTHRQLDNGRVVGAVLLIVLGIAFLADQFLNINLFNIFNISWPFYIIIPGVVCLVIALASNDKMANFAIPGAIITGTGLILLYQDTTNNYESWSYMWALYPVMVGLAVAYVGWRTHDPKKLHDGRRTATIWAIVTLVLAAIFEMLVFNHNLGLGRILVPLILVGLGAWLLLKPRAHTDDLFMMDEKPKNE